jgi:hypothetical protein
VSEWNQRELCPDGGCTGVIGPDGTCKVCGRAAPNWGDERRRGMVASAAPTDDDDHDDASDQDPIAPSAPAALGAAAEWSDREMCSDGACIGVLDERGVCRVCGKQDPAWKPRVPRSAPADDAALADVAADLAAKMPEAAVDALRPAPSLATAEHDADAAPDAEPVSGSDDEPRALCHDGACVGVIGADSKCKLCGKDAA